MEVNLDKSQIMIFQKGGRKRLSEQWAYKGEPVTIVPEYRYLGVVLPPSLSFKKHVSQRIAQAKEGICFTWTNFFAGQDFSVKSKWRLLLASKYGDLAALKKSIRCNDFS